MIEKLPEIQIHSCAKINEKLNEVIELLNAITIDVDGTKCVDGSKAPADPYAEQRKWVGKLCRFWDDNFKITKNFGILTRIDETAIVRYEAENGFWYCACEPVKPDDDIIYKGGDNE